MEKLSTKDVQNFAAGALALMGLNALIRLPGDLMVGSEPNAAIASSLTALSLPLAIGILARSRVAFRLTQVYLGVFAVAGWIGVVILLRTLPWQRLYGPWRGFVNSVVLATILLGVFWRTKSAKGSGSV